jgi:wyosine [tRNA(Phe)-imidazoG37] synthetase (radical SAM superfamily)
VPDVPSIVTGAAPPKPAPRRKPRNALCRGAGQTSQGCARNFLGQRFVYLLISPRARGLSVGVNLNPDKSCNFDCVYCEVDRTTPPLAAKLDIAAMAEELESTLRLIEKGKLREFPSFADLPAALLAIKHVTLSGDGEPTQCPVFREAVETITHLRASSRVPFFRLVLITNATGLELPNVQEGLRLFTPYDEIWAKLDVGTQKAMDLINRTTVPLEQVLANILQTARKRPVIIQSLFTAVDGKRMPEPEIMAYAERLKELREAGADIPLVQIYSANRPSPNGHCRHLDLRELSAIARQVRTIAGLNAEVF